MAPLAREKPGTPCETVVFRAIASERIGKSLAMTVADGDKFQRALSAFRAGNTRDAERLFKAVLARQSDHVAALNLLGIMMMQLGRFSEAENYLRRATEKSPNSDATLYNYGLTLKALDRPAEALERFSQALRLNPLPETWNNRGTVFNDLRRHREAIADFDRAIALNPNYPEALFNRGKAFAELKSYDEALADYDRTLVLKPDLVEAWLGRGNVLAERKNGKSALEAYDRALTLRPDLAGAWLGRANIFAAAGRHDDAFAAYDRALALKPDLAEASLGRGNVFTDLKRYDEAFAAYDKALTLKPDLAAAWLGQGNVLAKLKQRDQALAAYERALTLTPELAEAWLGKGNSFTELKDYEQAIACYDRALALKPDLAEAWLGRGNAHLELSRYRDAFVAYNEALTLDPDIEYAAGFRLLAKLYLCDWTDLEPEIERLLSTVREGKASTTPFVMLALPCSAADELHCARRYVQEQPVFPPLWRGEVHSHDRIRVAYLSGDFNDHPIAQLTVALFEHHDKSRFETTGISFGRDDNSPIRQRIVGAFDRFIDVRRNNDAEVADLIRRSEIDIAVDLAGFSQNNRSNILSRRPAPIQINYVGYPGTMGAPYIDYIIADSTIIPEAHCAFYEEAVIWLPDSFYVNDPRRVISERTPSRRECNLPDEGFVFCAFNNSYKIMPGMFDVWMRLLKKVDGSVLWLKVNEETTGPNLRREAQSRGVAPERLIFAPQVALQADHFARYRQADLFVDTLPYNAHTTASDALWAGLPVVTCLGETFAGRIAASVLKSAGLECLVTHSLEAYEALALKLAREPALLTSVREKLARNRTARALFDPKRATSQVEAAYFTVWESYQRGERPKSKAAKPILIG